MNDFGVVILVGVFMLVKWLMQRAGNSVADKQNNDSGTGRAESPVPQRRQPLPQSPENEDERMRRFMEALGLPAGSAPPEVPQRRSAPPAVQAAKVEESVSEQRPKLKRVQWPQRPPADRRRIAPPSEPLASQTLIPKTASMGESAPQMEVASIPEMAFATPESYIQRSQPLVTEEIGVPPVTSSALPLRLQLHNRGALRKALIMREILGAPKALQSAQSPSIFSPL